MSEFRTIETQEELDRIISEQLARQKDKFADYDQLKERVKELETENVELKSALDTSNQESASYNQQIEELQGKVSGYFGNEDSGPSGGGITDPSVMPTEPSGEAFGALANLNQ